MVRPRLHTDESILSAMRQAAMQYGPGVSLQTVADEIGISAPALLKRFGTREQLLLRALELPTPESFINSVRHMPDDRPLPAQLQDVLETLWKLFNKTVPCVAALRESGAAQHEVTKHLLPLRLTVIAWLKEWLVHAHQQRLIDCASYDAVTTAMVGAIQSTAFERHVLRKERTPKDHEASMQGLAMLFARALDISHARPQRITKKAKK
jgi:AcrR family transcriptional regulator